MNNLAICTRYGGTGEGRGAHAPYPNFGRSVNPISTRGTNYAHIITTGTPGFSDLPTALLPFELSVQVPVQLLLELEPN